MSRTLTTQDVEDLLQGAKIMGTGGGGEIDWARPLIEQVNNAGKQFRLVDPGDLKKSDISVISSRIGGGVGPEQLKKVEGLVKTERSPEQLAFKLLGERLDHSPDAVIPTELGAGNTLAAMCTAALLDKPTVDGDCMGRAKPELQISTTNVSGVPITPVCLVTEYGDQLYLDKAVSDVRAEDILRAVAAASGGIAGLCRCPMDGDTLRKSTVQNSISLCIEIGKTMREAPSKGQNPAEKVAERAGGRLLFTGNVSHFERDERGAFMWGSTSVKGTGDSSGHELKVWFKNEHILSWLDGKPFVTCPDTICVVDAATGQGLSNWGSDFAEGRGVVAFGIEANRFFRSEKGLEVFSPKSFGHDIKYVPMAELLK